MQLAAQIEQDIRGRCLRGEFLWPDYEGYCLSNLPATILRILGANADHRRSLPPEVWANYENIHRVVLIVLDALGYSNFLRLSQRLPDLPLGSRQGEIRFFPLTSVFPSTTATALSTLHTGLEPAEHGILGYRMYIPELDVVGNMIRFAPADGEGPDLLRRGLKPKRFLGTETISERLEEDGIESSSFVNRRYRGTGLTQMLIRGKQTLHLTSSDLIVGVRRWLDATENCRAYLYAYWDLLDMLGHEYGPGTEEYDAEAVAFLSLLQRELLEGVPAAARKETLVVFTSDHGQIPVSIGRSVSLKQHPEVLSRLRAFPAGDSRSVYLHLRPGETDTVLEYFSRNLGDAFEVLTRNEAIKNGLFGLHAMPANIIPRLGDLILLAKADYTFYYSSKPGHNRIDVKGVHGGLSEDEMLVPCLFVPLESIGSGEP